MVASRLYKTPALTGRRSREPIGVRRRWRKGCRGRRRLGNECDFMLGESGTLHGVKQRGEGQKDRREAGPTAMVGASLS